MVPPPKRRWKANYIILADKLNLTLPQKSAVANLIKLITDANNYNTENVKKIANTVIQTEEIEQNEKQNAKCEFQIKKLELEPVKNKLVSNLDASNSFKILDVSKLIIMIESAIYIFILLSLKNK